MDGCFGGSSSCACSSAGSDHWAARETVDMALGPGACDRDRTASGGVGLVRVGSPCGPGHGSGGEGEGNSDGNLLGEARSCKTSANMFGLLSS